MTDQQHPITPPQWKMDEWQARIETMGADVPSILLEVAQWSADQELEACCKWLDYNCPSVGAHHLRSARRPKPPSLKEQALEDLEQIDGHAVDQLSAYVIHGDLKRRVSNIRRALEALPDD